MSQEVSLGADLFGYTTLIKEGDTFVGLTGEGEKELRIGMNVVLLGNSKGYGFLGFSPGDEVTIIGFREAFKGGVTKKIVNVQRGTQQGWIKTSEIQLPIGGPKPSSPSDKRHLQMRKHVHPAAADLMDAVYLGLSEHERLSLPDKVYLYMDRLVMYALENIRIFGEILAETIARVYAESPSGERFIKDSVRSNSICDATLFLDSNGELVSVKNPEIVWDTSIPAALILKSYESYEVLTGPLRGRRISWQANALGNPLYRPGIVSGIKSHESNNRKPVKVFLCHSKEDKEKIRQLYARLRENGLEPWLDEIDLLPGMEWRSEIENAVRNADVVLVCLSKSSVMKTGFVQKEIAFALDTADEHPEGHIYVVPARLEACDMPQRLSRWQWVDLFEPDGYQKLVGALTTPNFDQLNLQSF
jgi:hypothetical protein